MTIGTTSQVTDVSVLYAWLNRKRRILSFTANDATGQDAVHLWEKATRDTVHHFPIPQTFLAVYDFSNVRIASVHLRAWHNHITTVSQYYSGHYAVVVSPRQFEPIVQVINHQQTSALQNQLKASVFSSREKAIAYLEQYI